MTCLITELYDILANEKYKHEFVRLIHEEDDSEPSGADVLDDIVENLRYVNRALNKCLQDERKRDQESLTRKLLRYAEGLEADTEKLQKLVKHVKRTVRKTSKSNSRSESAPLKTPDMDSQSRQNSGGASANRKDSRADVDMSPPKRRAADTHYESPDDNTGAASGEDEDEEEEEEEEEESEDDEDEDDESERSAEGEPQRHERPNPQEQQPNRAQEHHDRHQPWMNHPNANNPNAAHYPPPPPPGQFPINPGVPPYGYGFPGYPPPMDPHLMAQSVNAMRYMGPGTVANIGAGNITGNQISNMNNNNARVYHKNVNQSRRSDPQSDEDGTRGKNSKQKRKVTGRR